MKSLETIIGGQAGRPWVGALAAVCALAIPLTLPASAWPNCPLSIFNYPPRTGSVNGIELSNTIDRPPFTLTPTQRAGLAVLVESDPEAAKQFRNLRRKADAAAIDPGAPLTALHTAGRLASDPLKKASATSLEDMKKLHALAWAGALSTNAAYHDEAVRRIILRWAEVNQPAGQPIDDTKLEPLFVAYDLARPAFSSGQQKKVDDWLRRIAAAQLQSARPGSITASNNWQSHRLKVVGLIGFLLNDRALIDTAVRGFKQQVADNLRPDGSSLDFHHRDSLRYHCYTLEPLLSLALAARQNGIELYSHKAPNGASLSNAVRFLVPYCDGTKTHGEFARTRAGFDRARGQAGEKGFLPGEPFDPRDARDVFDLAGGFDDEFQALALRLHALEGRSGFNLEPGTRNPEPKRFPNWQSVLNKVRK